MAALKRKFRGRNVSLPRKSAGTLSKSTGKHHVSARSAGQFGKALAVYQKLLVQHPYVAVLDANWGATKRNKQLYIPM